VPVDPVLIRPSGALTGTTTAGGQFGWGAVYQIVP
jgi:hypothetical protein